MICCVNSCGAIFHTCKANEHSILCPESEIRCINNRNGCNHRVKRYNLSQHLKLDCPAMAIVRLKYNQLQKENIGKYLTLLKTC